MNPTRSSPVSCRPAGRASFAARLPRTAVRWAGAVVLGMAVAAAHAAPANISETFVHATAPGWAMKGNAALTAATGIDADGDGWLRLTGALPNQAGTAIYNQPFSSLAGVDVTFDYAAYGGTTAYPGDGISFYLVDGATANPTVGAPGGALGYAWRTRSWATPKTEPGVTNGYVGIGLDAYGNFPRASSDYGFGQCWTGAQPAAPEPPLPACSPYFTGNAQHLDTADSVGIRGSGNLAAPDGFLLLATRPVGSPLATGSRASAKQVRILITPAPDISISVWVGGTLVIDHRALTVGGTPVTGMAALPATFKMGFSSSTGGGANNIHEIRNVAVKLLQLQAHDDAYTATAGQPLDAPAGGASSLGANDDNVPPGAVFSLDTPPPAAQGSVTVNADGSFRFVPAPGFTGPTSAFKYQVCEPSGDLCSTATATITLQAPPLQAQPDSFTTPAGQPHAGNVATNNSNVPAGSTFSVTTPPPAAQGTVAMAADGSFTFTPSPGYSGPAAFAYQVCALGGSPCSTAAVTGTVTPAPAAPQAQPDTFGTPAGKPVSGSVAGNDTGVPTGSTFSVATPPPAAQGTVAMAADGSFTFTPAAGFTGLATFGYQVCAPGGAPCSSATVTVDVGSAAASIAPVPTLGAWALALLTLLLGTLGMRRAGAARR